MMRNSQKRPWLFVPAFIAIGAGVGAATHQLAIGIGLGVALGAIVAGVRSRKEGKGA